jgi:anti-sigma factor RsiW
VLLPWYATGQIDAADRELVDAHLGECAECRRQLQLEKQLIDTWTSYSPQSAIGFGRLRARMTSAEPAPERKRNWSERWPALNRPALAAAVFPFTLLVAVAVYLSSLTSPSYQTLGDQVETSANIIIVFRPETREADLRSAVRASGASFVGGPTEADAYLLHTAPQERASALAILSANDDVLLVEPINGDQR